MDYKELEERLRWWEKCKATADNKFVSQCADAIAALRAENEALLLCIQSACEELGEQVQPAFLADAIAALRAERDRAMQDAERYLDAIWQMADDGWLMHGEDGMSDVQEAVHAIAQEHPEYKRRAKVKP